MNNISPLERLVIPDYREYALDLLICGGKRNAYVFLCSECNQWISTTHFKVHLRSRHGFNWWDRHGQHFDELKEFIVHARHRDSFD